VLFAQAGNEMYSKVNSLTVSGKTRFPAESDSINIIMVRLQKRNPVSQTGKPGSRDGNSIKVIRYFYSFPATQVKTAMFRSCD